jgi:hypothetical protein
LPAGADKIVWVLRKDEGRDTARGVAASHVADADTYDAGVQPLSASQLAHRGLDTNVPRTEVYFYSNVGIRNDDRVRYQDASAFWHYVAVDNFVDEAGAGQVWVAEGKDFIEHCRIVSVVGLEGTAQIEVTFSQPVRQTTGTITGFEFNNGVVFEDYGGTVQDDPTKMLVLLDEDVLPEDVSGWRVRRAPTGISFAQAVFDLPQSGLVASVRIVSVSMVANQTGQFVFTSAATQTGPITGFEVKWNDAWHEVGGTVNVGDATLMDFGTPEPIAIQAWRVLASPQGINWGSTALVVPQQG